MQRVLQVQVEVLGGEPATDLAHQAVGEDATLQVGADAGSAGVEERAAVREGA